MRERIPSQKGVYALIIEVDSQIFVPVGKLGGFLFRPGYYAYVGSAQAGLRIRLRQHLNKKKNKYWHVDYLLAKARVKDVVFSITADKIECQVAQNLLMRLPCTLGFGVSDCQCESHLFYHPQRDQLLKEVGDAFSPYLYSIISED